MKSFKDYYNDKNKNNKNKNNNDKDKNKDNECKCPCFPCSKLKLCHHCRCKGCKCEGCKCNQGEGKNKPQTKTPIKEKRAANNKKDFKVVKPKVTDSKTDSVSRSLDRKNH